VTGALTRYRVMAYIVGIGLVILVCVGVPLKYAAGFNPVVAVVGPMHGFLYIVYLLTVLDLATRLRWNLLRIILVMAAGTIPFLSFVAERKVTADIRAGQRETKPVTEAG
jgi:integral membrane protein